MVNSKRNSNCFGTNNNILANVYPYVHNCYCDNATVIIDSGKNESIKKIIVIFAAKNNNR